MVTGGMWRKMIASRRQPGELQEASEGSGLGSFRIKWLLEIGEEPSGVFE